MISFHSEMNLFPFIGVEHPFYEAIQNLKGQLIATPLYKEMRQKLDAGEEAEIRISMKAHPSSDSALVLKGFCVSLQCKERLGSRSFLASTFLGRARKGLIECYKFPYDPCLPTLASFFEPQNLSRSGRHDTGNLDVLRYYPRKRLTFRANQAGENACSAIGKFVRESKVEETYNKLVKISRATLSTRSFSVAAPVGIEGNNGLFFQEEKPGSELAQVINGQNFRQLLYDVGVIHRDLHKLNVSGLPEFDFGAFLRNLYLAVDWVSCCQPDAKSFVHHLRDLLANHVPWVNSGEYRFCHGDFSCIQILKSNGNYSVIDFDECMLGDPYLEIGRLLAFLKYDVPLFRNCIVDPKQEGMGLLKEACGAYLRGYQDRAREALDQRRLLWYRICFEIHYLARLFKRDLFHPLAFDRSIEIMHDLKERFAQEKGEGC